MSCPCGLTATFEDCCGPYLAGTALPPTAEALMRSRYAAYTKGDIAYVERTLAPESRHDFDATAAHQWANASTWKGLRIIGTEAGGADDSIGKVEFVASFSQKGKSHDHHELAEFRKDEAGQWYFVDGHPPARGEGARRVETVRREVPKIGRNDPCPCGSGAKHKKCCGAAA
ncbi:MAG: YchJ family protein [Hyphomicrobiaceae bacterium]|nr:YchJ family protein [Hyphomicrobiaceae bacterium]